MGALMGERSNLGLLAFILQLQICVFLNEVTDFYNLEKYETTKITWTWMDEAANVKLRRVILEF